MSRRERTEQGVTEPLRAKQLSADNWLDVDPTMAAYYRGSDDDGHVHSATNDEWAREVFSITLSEPVPQNVRDLFTATRAVLLYGCFYHPLWAVGMERAFQVAEVAVKYKCREFEAANPRWGFSTRLEYLKEQEVFTEEQYRAWDQLRYERNRSAHPDHQANLAPAFAITMLRVTARMIDALFVPSGDAG